MIFDSDLWWPLINKSINIDLNRFNLTFDGWNQSMHSPQTLNISFHRQGASSFDALRLLSFWWEIISNVRPENLKLEILKSVYLKDADKLFHLWNLYLRETMKSCRNKVRICVCRLDVGKHFTKRSKRIQFIWTNFYFLNKISVFQSKTFWMILFNQK